MIKPLDTLVALKILSLSDNLSGTDKRVGAVLIEHFNRKTGQCDPSLDTIADLIGVDRRTVVRSVNRLVKSELFRKIRHGGKFHRNSYEPMWVVFHQRDDTWCERRRARRARYVSPNMSRCGGRPRHLADDENATQTFPKNHFKETLVGVASKRQQPALPQPKADGSADFDGWAGAEDTLERLKMRIGEPACRNWFGKVQFVGYRDGIIVLTVLDVFYRNNITNRYEPQLLASFRSDYPKLFRIELEIRGDLASSREKASQQGTGG
jgi:hypothetical protein